MNVYRFIMCGLVLILGATSVAADEFVLEPVPLPVPPDDSVISERATVTQSPVVADTAPRLQSTIVTPAPVITQAPVPVPIPPAMSTTVTTTTYRTTYAIPTQVVYGPPVTVLRPVTATIATPVVTLRPVTTVTTLQPVVPATVYHVAPPALIPIGPPVYVRPRLYVPGQPVRNFFRGSVP